MNYPGIRVCDASVDGQFQRLAGGTADGWKLLLTATDANTDPDTRAYAEAYEKEYAEKPGAYSVEAYDVTNLIIEAAKSVHNAGGRLTREAMITVVRAFRYKGAAKEYAFDIGSGEFAGPEGTIAYEVKAGETTFLGSAAKLAAGG